MIVSTDQNFEPVHENEAPTGAPIDQALYRRCESVIKGTTKRFTCIERSAHGPQSFAKQYSTSHEHIMW